MAIDDLPLPVVNLLNVFGIKWPYLNEDQVSKFATLLRGFATAVETTHEDATKQVHAIAEAHKGASTQTMLDGWEKLSARHVHEIVDGCKVLADGLDAFCVWIVAQKAIAIAELVGIAASFVAIQAESAVTFGAAELELIPLRQAAAKVAKSIEMDIQQYLIGKLIEVAAKPLFEKVDKMLSGLDWSKSGAVAPTGTPGLSVDAQGVAVATKALRNSASVMQAHAGAFSSAVKALHF